MTLVDTLLQHLFEYREVRTNGYCIENGMDRTVELLVSRFFFFFFLEKVFIQRLYNLKILSRYK